MKSKIASSRYIIYIIIFVAVLLVKSKPIFVTICRFII